MILSISLGRRSTWPVSFVDDLVVVVLAGELEGRVPLAELELVGGLGRPRPEPLEQRLHRRRDDEDQERLGDLLLDDLGALDVDLEDHVLAGGERRRGPGRAASRTSCRGPRSPRGSRRASRIRRNSSRLTKW